MDAHTLLGVAGFIVSLLVFAFGLVRWQISAIAKLRDDTKATIDAMHERVNKTREDHQNFKVEVAEKYVSVSHLSEVETRLVKSIDDLGTELRSHNKQVIAALSDRTR